MVMDSHTPQSVLLILSIFDRFMFHQSYPHLSIGCKQVSTSAFGSLRFLWAQPI